MLKLSRCYVTVRWSLAQSLNQLLILKPPSKKLRLTTRPASMSLLLRATKTRWTSSVRYENCFHKQFVEHYAKLPDAQKKRLEKAIILFRHEPNHAALYNHSL